MFGNPSMMTRIAVGKSAGFVIGLMAFIAFPIFIPEATWMERVGILFWYTTLGAIIGVFGVMTYHPILKLPFPWWIRAPMLGAWMNFVLMLLTWDWLANIMLAIFGEGGLFLSPYWFVLEGAIVGLIIGFFATRFGGEGPDTAAEMAR